MFVYTLLGRFQLKRRDPSLNVVVYEMAPGLGYGSSGYSTGFLRAYYSFDETMHLALDGINAYHNWGEVLIFYDVPSPPPLPLPFLPSVP